jgi:hypothetical protein
MPYSIDPDAEPPRRPLLLPGQIVTLVAFHLLPAILFVVMWVVKPDYIATLWQTPLGIKMLTSALVMLMTSAVILVPTFILLNRFVPLERKATHKSLTRIIAILCFVLFFFPVIFTILIGPAAIQIMENMLK